MAKTNRPLPYYRFYVLDYRASRRVQHLTYIERGLYRELLDECWLKGAIPDDNLKLAEICGCPLGVMAEAWPHLRSLFEPTEGLDGMFLSSPRLDGERTEVDKFRSHQSLAGKASANKRALSSTTVNHGQPRSTSSSSSSSSSSSRAEQSSSSSRGEQAASPDGAACSRCSGRGSLHSPDCPALMAEP